jgi:hypothetical protein
MYRTVHDHATVLRVSNKILEVADDTVSFVYGTYIYFLGCCMLNARSPSPIAIELMKKK